MRHPAHERQSSLPTRKILRHQQRTGRSPPDSRQPLRRAPGCAIGQIASAEQLCRRLYSRLIPESLCSTPDHHSAVYKAALDPVE